jgi:hypothetical protein
MALTEPAVTWYNSAGGLGQAGPWAGRPQRLAAILI